MADEKKVCILPPMGWFCTRESGHEGPCTAHPISLYGNEIDWLSGNDAGAAGAAQRWKEALEDPIPKPGVMGEPLESLYRRTEALRQSQISTIEIKDGSILVVRNWETAQAIAGAKVGVDVTIIVAPDGVDEMTPELLEEAARRAKRSNSQS